MNKLIRRQEEREAWRVGEGGKGGGTLRWKHERKKEPTGAVLRFAYKEKNIRKYSSFHSVSNRKQSMNAHSHWSRKYTIRKYLYVFNRKKKQIVKIINCLSFCSCFLLTHQFIIFYISTQMENSHQNGKKRFLEKYRKLRCFYPLT